jgi:hypothetical protein
MVSMMKLSAFSWYGPNPGFVEKIVWMLDIEALRTVGFDE